MCILYKHKLKWNRLRVNHNAVSVDVWSIKMLHLDVIVFMLLFCCIQAYVVEEHWVTLHPNLSGIGDILFNANDVSVMSCGQECNSRENCTAANYFPSNKTCTLHYVGDVLDDWVEKDDDDITYICIDCQPGIEGF